MVMRVRFAYFVSVGFSRYEFPFTFFVLFEFRGFVMFQRFAILNEGGDKLNRS